MTAPSFAQSAAKHLEIADNLVCEQVTKKVLMQHDLPVGVRVFLARKHLLAWVTSPRSMRLDDARRAEQAHELEVAS